MVLSIERMVLLYNTFLTQKATHLRNKAKVFYYNTRIKEHMNTQLSDSRLANIAAQVMCRWFDQHQAQFMQLTQQARHHFEQRTWNAARHDVVQRLELYGEVLSTLVEELQELLGERQQHPLVWVSIKAVYSGLIAQRDDWELAETFYNSVTRRIFTTVGVNEQLEFMHTDFATPLAATPPPVYQSYMCHSRTTQTLITTILQAYGFTYADCERDAFQVALLLDAYLHAVAGHTRCEQIDMLKVIFFRNRGAYLVGRIKHQGLVSPLVLALRSTEAGVEVDALLTHEREVSVLFSFTRAHFHVAATRPYDVVQFLASILPSKRIAELYTALGYHKHGKTELYRNLLHHLSSSSTQFEIAPGERGMVMLVFALPDYDMVFKLIKDRFTPPKDTTRRKVMQKYELVFKHDRAGRLVEAHEFEHLKLERSRFQPDLLAELQNLTQQAVEVQADHVILRHVYLERRVTPLDIYLREAAAHAATAAVIEFGQAIKDLAGSNIFPGDMLLKNFGVTRNKRVVFYDYDELCLLQRCQFKQLPEPSDYDEALAAEPWYAIGEYDVFPEEFRHFLGLKQPLRSSFMDEHGELLTVEWWQSIQARLAAGELIDIIPYPAQRRFQVLF